MMTTRRCGSPWVFWAPQKASNWVCDFKAWCWSTRVCPYIHTICTCCEEFCLGSRQANSPTRQVRLHIGSKGMSVKCVSSEGVDFVTERAPAWCTPGRACMSAWGGEWFSRAFGAKSNGLQLWHVSTRCHGVYGPAGPYCTLLRPAAHRARA